MHFVFVKTVCVILMGVFETRDLFVSFERLFSPDMSLTNLPRNPTAMSVFIKSISQLLLSDAHWSLQ